MYSNMCSMSQYIEMLRTDFCFSEIVPNSVAIMPCLGIEVYIVDVWFLVWLVCLLFFLKVFWQMEEFCEASL